MNNIEIINSMNDYLKVIYLNENVNGYVRKYMEYDRYDTLNLTFVIGKDNIFLVSFNIKNDIIISADYDSYWIDDFDNIIHKSNKEKGIGKTEAFLGKFIECTYEKIE